MSALFSKNEINFVRSYATVATSRVRHILAIHCPACLGDAAVGHTACLQATRLEAIRTYLDEIMAVTPRCIVVDTYAARSDGSDAFELFRMQVQFMSKLCGFSMSISFHLGLIMLNSIQDPFVIITTRTNTLWREAIVALLLEATANQCWLPNPVPPPAYATNSAPFGLAAPRRPVQPVMGNAAAFDLDMTVRPATPMYAAPPLPPPIPPPAATSTPRQHRRRTVAESFTSSGTLIVAQDRCVCGRVKDIDNSRLCTCVVLE